jgi:hypothetical protein
MKIFSNDQDVMKPFGVSDNDFLSFQKLLKENILSESGETKTILYYTENGVKIKQMPDGTKYEIRNTENGNHEIVRKLS